jgi:hypothetical protein
MFILLKNEKQKVIFFRYCYLKPTLCYTQYKHKKVNTLLMQINLSLAREDILNEKKNRISEVAPLILDYNYTVSEKQKLAVAQRIHQF